MICEYLNTWTKQQVFDKVAKHLLEQNEESSKNGACLYRGPRGLKCAAGCLITSKEYRKGLEFRDWQELIDCGLVPGKHKELIKALQQLHDQTKDTEYWLDGLKSIATEFGLNKLSLKLKGTK